MAYFPPEQRWHPRSLGRAFGVVGGDADRDFDDGAQGLKLGAVTANDAVVKVGHALRCHRYDQGIFQLLRPRIISPLEAGIVMDVEVPALGLDLRFVNAST